MNLSDQEIADILNKDGARLYFIGIGGIAMSAAANLARSFGYEVSGSDSREVYSPAKDVLDRNKIQYFVGYDAKHVTDAQVDLFIVSAGEGPENPELKFVLESNRPRVGLAELLYELSKDDLRILVAGTHGKTTTSGLLGHLVRNLDNSSFMAGGVLQNYQSNFYRGDGHYFVFEGDEYKEQFDDPTPKFQYYKPDILVLTNLEYDHPDQFESLEALQQEFSLLIEGMPEDGLIVYNADDANLGKLVHRSNVTSVSFGIDNEADFQVRDIRYGPDNTAIEVSNKFSKDMLERLLEKTEEYKIQLPGRINVYNALAAIATLRTLGFSRENLVLDLLSYQGIKRRFELVGTKNGVVLIDDYAHHPTAVRETLEAARLRYFSSSLDFNDDQALKVKNKATGRLWAVFEPHTFSRTKATLVDLLKSFDSADEVLLSEIYAAREKIAEATISSANVVQAIKDQGSKIKDHIRLVRDKQQALNILKKEAKPGDVIIVMAVGNFNRLAYELKDLL